MSGPLIDRIDLHVDVPSVSAADLALPPAAEASVDVARRVAAAWEIQSARYAAHGIHTNAEADGELLEAVAAPEPAGQRLLVEAAEKLKLSARGYHRVLRIARTLADLDGADLDGADLGGTNGGVGGGSSGKWAPVRRIHIAEALSYRRAAPGRW